MPLCPHCLSRVFFLRGKPPAADRSSRLTSTSDCARWRATYNPCPSSAGVGHDARRRPAAGSSCVRGPTMRREALACVTLSTLSTRWHPGAMRSQPRSGSARCGLGSFGTRSNAKLVYRPPSLERPGLTHIYPQ
jgi:hypothetical protein